jgi:S-adenosyl-L-methionine hydrolase (adenosine-forming)
MSPKVITLTTDFGLVDPYVAEMKAVILKICPGAIIVDVSHGIQKFNIQMGAFILSSVTHYFPFGTINVAVVDPSVGTKRGSIIIETEQGFFIGPDNGLLVLAAEKQGIKSITQLENQNLMLSHVSNTFHGRDVFAPAAAHLSNDFPLSKFGPKITEIVRPAFTKIEITPNSLTGEILYIDDFGNLITNIQMKDITSFVDDSVEIELGSETLSHMKLSKTYAETEPNRPLALIGSHDYLEIAINQGNAAEKFSLKTGDRITLKRA